MQAMQAIYNEKSHERWERCTRLTADLLAFLLKVLLGFQVVCGESASAVACNIQSWGYSPYCPPLYAHEDNRRLCASEDLKPYSLLQKQIGVKRVNLAVFLGCLTTQHIGCSTYRLSGEAPCSLWHSFWGSNMREIQHLLLWRVWHCRCWCDKSLFHRCCQLCLLLTLVLLRRRWLFNLCGVWSLCIIFCLLYSHLQTVKLLSIILGNKADGCWLLINGALSRWTCARPGFRPSKHALPMDCLKTSEDAKPMHIIDILMISWAQFF